MRCLRANVQVTGASPLKHAACRELEQPFGSHISWITTFALWLCNVWSQAGIVCGRTLLSPFDATTWTTTHRAAAFCCCCASFTAQAVYPPDNITQRNVRGLNTAGIFEAQQASRNPTSAKLSKHLVMFSAKSKIQSFGGSRHFFFLAADPTRKNHANSVNNCCRRGLGGWRPLFLAG